MLEPDLFNPCAVYDWAVHLNWEPIGLIPKTRPIRAHGSGSRCPSESYYRSCSLDLPPEADFFHQEPEFLNLRKHLMKSDEKSPSDPIGSDGLAPKSLLPPAVPEDEGDLEPIQKPSRRRGQFHFFHRASKNGTLPDGFRIGS